MIFTSPWARDEAGTRVFISDSLPGSTDAQLSYILKTLYPPIFDGSPGLPYRSFLERATTIVSELGVDCNSDYLARAVDGNIYNYLYDIPPALHGDDEAYTFYDGTDPSVDAKIAHEFQDYILNFVRVGNPNGYGLPNFQRYGKTGWTLDVRKGGFRRTTNIGNNERCRSFQRFFK